MLPPLGRSHRCPFVGLFAAAMIVASSPLAHAQTTPEIESLFPPGAQRGTEVEVQYGGDYMPGPCRLSSAGDGVTLQPTDAAERYRFVVAKNAATGPHEIRLSSVQGASPPFPFLVGELPEVIHTNNSAPLELKLPVTANGRLDGGGNVDEYAVTLAAGTQIVCAAVTRAIRSPIDPMMRLLDADGKQVAASFSHRSADALLTYRAERAGRYVLQFFDFQMGGGTRHIYRLTVTAGPWLDYAYPAGLPHNVETPVTVFGWNLPSPKGVPLVLRVPPQPVGRYELTLPDAVNRLTLPVDENPELPEVEPNDAAEQAATLPFPATVNGRLNAPGDADLFAFTAKKGEKFAIDFDSAKLQFAGDLVLSIVGAPGKPIESDDAKGSRDPSLRFTAPADGRYLISLRDRSRGGGEDYVYRLRFAALRPDVTARVNATSLIMHAGKTTNLPVVIDRLDGLADDLEVTAVDLPAGVEVKPQAVPPKTPATVQLPFTVTDKTVPLGQLVRVVVRSKKADAAIERTALIAESAAATSGGDVLWLAVSPEIPFTLKISTTILDAPRLAGFPFPVTVTRKEGFTDAIRLVGVEPDRRGTLIPLEGEIAAAADAGSIPLVLQNKVTEGTTHRCRVMGVAEVPGLDGKRYAVFHIAAGNMSVGCEPSLLTLTPEAPIIVRDASATQRIEVRLMRRTKMQPVTLRLVSPKSATGITCEPVEVGGDQDRATLVLHFAPDAVLPPRMKLEIKAESSHNGLPIYGTTSFRLESL